MTLDIMTVEPKGGSLVDYFDTDGRRFVLALPNSPHVTDPRGSRCCFAPPCASSVFEHEPNS